MLSVMLASSVYVTAYCVDVTSCNSKQVDLVLGATYM